MKYNTSMVPNMYDGLYPCLPAMPYNSLNPNKAIIITTIKKGNPSQNIVKKAKRTPIIVVDSSLYKIIILFLHIFSLFFGNFLLLLLNYFRRSQAKKQELPKVLCKQSARA